MHEGSQPVHCHGRSIRHARDYASIVLVDQRYARTSVREKLPDWITSQLQVCQGFGQAFAAVRKVQTCMTLERFCLLLLFMQFFIEKRYIIGEQKSYNKQQH